MWGGSITSPCLEILYLFQWPQVRDGGHGVVWVDNSASGVISILAMETWRYLEILNNEKKVEHCFPSWIQKWCGRIHMSQVKFNIDNEEYVTLSVS